MTGRLTDCFMNNYEITEQDRNFMALAIQKATDNVRNGGGPFGAVIVKDGHIVVATEGNRVTANNDPTAHAEIQAIRAACRALGTFDLSGCTLYSSCEPCPMCLGAIYWAHLDRFFYAVTQYDAREAGFDDSYIYSEFAAEPHNRSLPALHLQTPDGLKPFNAWIENVDKIKY